MTKIYFHFSRANYYFKILIYGQLICEIVNSKYHVSDEKFPQMYRAVTNI